MPRVRKMTATDYIVAAGVAVWLALHLVHRSEKPRVHEPCTPLKAERSPVSTWGFSEALPVLPKEEQ